LFSALLLSFSIPLQNVDSQSTSIVSVERGDTWEKTTNSDGTIQHTFGMPLFIVNHNGDYVNAMLFEDKNYLYVDYRSPLKIDKDTCELIELEQKRISQNPDTVQTTKFIGKHSDDGVTFLDILPNNAKSFCKISYSTDSTGTNITLTQSKGDYTLETLIELTADEIFGETTSFLSHSGQTQKYLQIVEQKTIQSVTAEIKLDDSVFQINSNDDKLYQRELTNPKNPINQEIKFDKSQIKDYRMTIKPSDNTGNELLYDMKNAEQFLSNVSIMNQGGKLVSVIIFEDKEKQYNANEKFEYDPTFGYVTSPSYRVYDTVGGGGDCSDDIQDSYGVSTNFRHDAISCMPLVTEFDTALIPDAAIIDSANIRFDVTTIWQAIDQNCVFRGLDTPISSSQITFDEAISNTKITESSADCKTIANNYVHALNAAGLSHLQGKIQAGVNFYGISFAADDPTATQTAESATDSFSLQVTYTLPVVPQPPTNLTASAVSDDQINLSWIAPTGSITGYKIEREFPVGGGFSVLVGDTGSGFATYSDLGLTAQTQYNYRVSTINENGISVPSNESDATTNSATSPGSGTSSSSVIAISIPVDDVTLNPGEILPLLDTTGTGSINLVSVLANLPCTSNIPDVIIKAGILGANVTNVIESLTDYTGYSGPNGTCLFRDMSNSTSAGITINSLILSNDGASPVTIPKGVIITLTGIFE